MQVRETKSAIEAYIRDLAVRSKDGAGSEEVVALTSLLGLFKGQLAKPFASLRKKIAEIKTPIAGELDSAELAVSTALAPLERLLELMDVFSTANRRQDMKTLIKLLRPHESVNVTALVKAVQLVSSPGNGGRLGRMPIAELKRRLDASLGDDEEFNMILKHLRRLGDGEFKEVAKTVLHGPIKSKKQGVGRLISLHKTARAQRLTKAATAGRTAA